MAYVGRTPANAAITASDLENGIWTVDFVFNDLCSSRGLNLLTPTFFKNL